MSALNEQRGGDHYKKMKVQPVDFAMRNGWDACAFSVLKYLSRAASKDGRLDAEKAGHFVALREELWAPNNWPNGRYGMIMMADYISKNGFEGRTAECLQWLEDWVVGDPRDKEPLNKLKQGINAIIEGYPA